MSALQSHFYVLCPLEGGIASTNLQPDSPHNEFSLDCLMWEMQKPASLTLFPLLLPLSYMSAWLYQILQQHVFVDASSQLWLHALYYYQRVLQKTFWYVLRCPAFVVLLLA